MHWYLRVYVGSCGHILGVETASPSFMWCCSKSRFLPGKSSPTEGDKNPVSILRKYNRTDILFKRIMYKDLKLHNVHVHKNSLCERLWSFVESGGTALPFENTEAFKFSHLRILP